MKDIRRRDMSEDMNEIIMWCMDEFPATFHKVHFDTVELMLNARDGNVEQAKDDLRMMIESTA